jgi:hypothetical protein
VNGRLGFVVSLLAIGLGLSAGCSSGTFVPSPAVVNITGDWTGKCTGSGCIETDVYLRLNQGRNTVEGTFSAGGRSQYSRPRPVLKGLVAERKFTFEIRGDAGDLVRFDLTIHTDADAMSGTAMARSSMGLTFSRKPR